MADQSRQQMTELETIACITRVVVFGDERAFEKIVRAYEQPLRMFLLNLTEGDSMLADDLAQDTFVRAWQKMSAFQRASRFKTWLFSIAYHLYLDDCRRRKTRRVVDAALLPVLDVDNRDEVAAEEWVHRAMERMPEPARTCLTLFYMQSMTAAEVARVTGLTEKNVRQILFRYKPKLKDQLIQTRNAND